MLDGVLNNFFVRTCCYPETLYKNCKISIILMHFVCYSLSALVKSVKSKSASHQASLKKKKKLKWSMMEKWTTEVSRWMKMKPLCEIYAVHWLWIDLRVKLLALGSHIFPPDPSCSRALINKLDKIFFKKLGKRLSDVFEKIAGVYRKSNQTGAV